VAGQGNRRDNEPMRDLKECSVTGRNPLAGARPWPGPADDLAAPWLAASLRGDGRIGPARAANRRKDTVRLNVHV
jgi:hypothetical protein